MSARTITGTAKAWLPTYGRLNTLSGDSDAAVVELAYANGDMEAHGWTPVGVASITVTLDDDETIIGSKVEAMRAEKAKVLADATAKATEIERSIQSLLAIGHTPESFA